MYTIAEYLQFISFIAETKSYILLLDIFYSNLMERKYLLSTFHPNTLKPLQPKLKYLLSFSSEKKKIFYPKGFSSYIIAYFSMQSKFWKIIYCIKYTIYLLKLILPWNYCKVSRNASWLLNWHYTIPNMFFQIKFKKKIRKKIFFV